MKSFWLLMAASMVLMFGCLLPEEATAGEQATQPAWGDPLKAPVPDAKPVTVVRVPADAPAELTAFALRKGPTRKQRRAMGVTFRNARDVLAEMQQAGEVEDKDSAVLATEILNHLVDKNPAGFQAAMQVAGADWVDFIDRLMALIEKWLPLLLKLIALIS